MLLLVTIFFILIIRRKLGSCARCYGRVICSVFKIYIIEIMSRHTSTPYNPAQSPGSRLDAVLRAGTALRTAPIGVAGNTPHKNSPVFRAKSGYWATPEVYDVRITRYGKIVAVVGFMEFRQKEGALSSQGSDMEQRILVINNKDHILDIAREYARKQTGWELQYP